MSGLIPNFAPDGVVTLNRVILKPEYSVDDLQERVAQEHGFAISDHRLELYGTCAECRVKKVT